MIKAFALLKRAEGMSLEEFRAWWLGPHAELAKRLPGLLEYRISIRTGDPNDNPFIPGEPPFDGIAEIWFESREALLAAWKRTAEGDQAVADSLAHTSLRVNLVTEEYRIV